MATTAGSQPRYGPIDRTCKREASGAHSRPAASPRPVAACEPTPARAVKAEHASIDRNQNKQTNKCLHVWAEAPKSKATNDGAATSPRSARRPAPDVGAQAWPAMGSARLDRNGLSQLCVCPRTRVRARPCVRERACVCALCLLSLRERLLPEGGEPLLIITPTPVFFDRTLLRSFPTCSPSGGVRAVHPNLPDRYGTEYCIPAPDVLVSAR